MGQEECGIVSVDDYQITKLHYDRKAFREPGGLKFRPH